MPTLQTIQIARDVRAALAGAALTERQAKLYSQRLRREMGRDGLATFVPGDIESHLDDAIKLLECALIERRFDSEGPWRNGVKRAGEILEWLSQSDLKPPDVPLHLLCAAAYQVAGYPAMALGHLRRMPNEPVSPLLREFLRANFPSTTEAVYAFWANQRGPEVEPRPAPDDLSLLAVRHTVMCVGTVCAFLRSGIDTTVPRALRKLENLADGFLHSRDHFSHLLARLTAATCRYYIESSLWPHITALQNVSSQRAAEAFVQFGRAAYLNRRALVWPAQSVGIVRLLENDSFVLCTPTGSGKTTVATLAIVQALFAEGDRNDLTQESPTLGNLILYLVPSRAIAAEVENRLSQDLRGIAAVPVVVTGLYGGVDWGPTDAWIQTPQPTIVICTFEKADALLRYLGVLFLSRVRLIVIDEAHMVEQNISRVGDLESGASRAYRLEQLGTRLLHAQDNYHFRIVALSAVAAGAAPALARWISGRSDALPATSDHRSTRQMLGRVEVSERGNFTITYDLMDGRSLTFEDERRGDSPYVRAPFPALPGGVPNMAQPEAAMKVPTLWAAIHLASERPDGSRPSVLISLSQHVEAFARTCADQLDAWPAETLPPYTVAGDANEKWTKCLASAADYFTTASVEYRLLERGIAVHHGKMPSLLARRLKAVIDSGYVRVIIATSTLSEGVNIPVNYLLIPNVFRGQSPFSVQEFSNLIGRVGRPGVSTEGHAFVVLPERRRTPSGGLTATRSRQWLGYERLKTAMQETLLTLGQHQQVDAASSSLSQLLLALEDAWRRLTGSASQEQFTEWLERTAVSEGSDNTPANSLLDSLDTFLLAAIQEVEELLGADITADVLETELINIWRHTYAFASTTDEERLRHIWLGRGRSIKERYPDARQRRQIYKTSLSPRSALVLLDQADHIKNKLLDGNEYASMSTEQRLAFIGDVLDLLSHIPSFRLDRAVGSGKSAVDWTTLLRWWLAKTTLIRQPRPNQITKWYQFVAQNFIYRGAWGIGSILGLLLDLGEGDQPVRALEIDDWPRSGLPWIAFWLKELLAWGTLDPVAAFLLARGNRLDRPQAESEARAYYAQVSDQTANDQLDPRRIASWMQTQEFQPQSSFFNREFVIDARLEREVEAFTMERLMVSPIDDGYDLLWIDPAGYLVARSAMPDTWSEIPSGYDFELSVLNSTVSARPYLPYFEPE
jgi:superfamily II DNA/RNA helicase